MDPTHPQQSHKYNYSPFLSGGGNTDSSPILNNRHLAFVVGRLRSSLWALFLAWGRNFVTGFIISKYYEIQIFRPLVFIKKMNDSCLLCIEDKPDWAIVAVHWWFLHRSLQPALFVIIWDSVLHNVVAAPGSVLWSSHWNLTSQQTSGFLPQFPQYLRICSVCIVKRELRLCAVWSEKVIVEACNANGVCTYRV